MKKFRCTVCGEIHVQDSMPAECRICKAKTFVEINDSASLSFATEHVVGIIKDVPAQIIEGLRANFNGECMEVGMYLAMSRAADREGYPEIAQAFKAYAYEEAEHAAKFAEMLGEVLSADTKTNLQMRMNAENGACSGKYELAKAAKQNNLDAIHDTVHEMAKDEARHGKGFEGLYNRYFKK